MPFPLSALLRPRQRFIPSPRLVAFGAGRAQGGADGPVMDRTAAPPGPVPLQPHHPSGAAVPGSALTRLRGCGRSPSGAPHRIAQTLAFGFFRAGPRLPTSVGKARGVGSVPGLATGPFSSLQPLVSTQGLLGCGWFCPSGDTVAPCDIEHRGTGTAGSQPDPLAPREEPGLEPDISPHILQPHQLNRENECVVPRTNQLRTRLSLFPWGPDGGSQSCRIPSALR